MFQLVFSTLAAFKQVATFIAGLVCWGLGGLLLGNAVYWRLHAQRVQGEVIGVRRAGNCLNAVYRYVSPAGETVEATSLEGSSSTRGKETGRRVPLWVIPEKPQEVQEAGNHVFTIIGVLLLGAGVGLFWIGATVWRIGPMTWAVGALVLVHLLQKLRSIIAPKDKSLPRLPWRDLLAQMKAARAQAAAPAPVQQVEELMARPEYRVNVIRQRTQLRRFAPIMVLVGVALLGLGVRQSNILRRLESSGVRAYGVVISLRASGSGSGGPSYYPVVEYTDGRGQRVVFRDSTGTNPPMYHAGEAVEVLYSPGEEARAVIDRSVWNWLPAILLFLFGGVLLAAGFAAYRSRRNEDPLPAESGDGLVR